ncbi:hypothetical protein LUZ60_003085 [Juncus effusus]|nr:hypothetical protein LUZ60_003085 [Juncus effusus]
MAIPIVDLSPFFTGDEAGILLSTETINQACRTCGFFRIVNHGIPSELMDRALSLSKEFFSLTDEEKQRVKPVEGSKSPLPAGYAKQPENSMDKNEYCLFFSPGLGFNLYPDRPAEFKATIEECYSKLTETALLIQEILNKSMGLAPNFLKEYNKNRNFDFMAALRYFPSSEMDQNDNGLSEHQDGNCITLVFQDSIGGLEVLKDGDWIPVDPKEEGIIVNIGDLIQVLSNDKLKSAMHRVTRKREYRHSFAFFFNIDGEKWIEPVPQFTENIGEKPKYKGFYYNEYLQLRMRNKTHPASRPENVIHITHYAI